MKELKSEFSNSVERCDSTVSLERTIYGSGSTWYSEAPAGSPLEYGTRYCFCATSEIEPANPNTDGIFEGACIFFETEVRSYKIGGEISGLAGEMVLQNNSADDLTITEDGKFQFSTEVKDGEDYAVTVKTSPAGQTCTVNDGTGTVSGGNVDSISVVCAWDAFFVGGMVTGLSTEKTVVLQNNSADDLTVTKNGTFQFVTKVANGAGYAVTVKTQPIGQTCEVSSGTRTIDGADVEDVVVTCSANVYSIGGTVSGLSEAETIILRNNNDAESQQTLGNVSYAFSVGHGSNYAITVYDKPARVTCTVENSSGTATADVTDANVICSENAYTIGGTLSGLGTSGNITLQNNGEDDLVISTDGEFEFSELIAYGAEYNVTVSVQPSDQTCTVESGSGTTYADVDDVLVTCIDNHYVGGTIADLLNDNELTLKINAEDPEIFTGSGETSMSFAFIKNFPEGSEYTVSITAQPEGQTCSITAGATGTVSVLSINEIEIDCTLNEYAIGGTMSGLGGTVQLRLWEDGSQLEILDVTEDGSFVFTEAVTYDAAYVVDVKTHPTDQYCTVTNGTGTVGGDITDVEVECLNTYSVGGTISGHTGTVVLRNNDEGYLTVATGTEEFTFTTKLFAGDPYAVTILTHPSGQTCTVTANGSGTISDADVTDVVVLCTTNLKTFVTSTTHKGGDVGGITGADTKCMAMIGTGGYPSTGTYKALIAGSARSIASNWVLKAYTTYTRYSDSTTIATSNSNKTFDFSTSGEFRMKATWLGGTTTLQLWTGLSSSWENDSATCYNWTNNTDQGSYGVTTTTGSGAIRASQYSCASLKYLLCIEQ